MSNIICKNCGVELDKGLSTCPLCAGQKPLASKHERESKPSYPSEVLKISDKDKKKYAWELTGIICASAILISLIVDLVTGKGLTWALYATIAFSSIWICITLFIFFAKRLFLLSSGMMLNLLAMLALIDIVDVDLNWFAPVGFPIGISFVLLITAVILVSRRVKYKGFNILAFILLAIAILCTSIELSLDLFLDNNVTITWSAITAATIVPFSGILMFLHYRLKRGKNLKSFFHI